MIGSEIAAHSRPDGYTFVMGTASNISVVYSGASTTPQTFQGTNPALFSVRDYTVQSGSGFSAEDVTAHAKVAVIGLTVAKNLLEGFLTFSGRYRILGYNGAQFSQLGTMFMGQVSFKF